MKVIGCVGAPGSQRSAACVSKKVRSTARLPANRPPEQASEPQTTRILGLATASQQIRSASAILTVIGPDTTTPSAWRGEAVKPMP